jgi:septal ring factor EnvC (AmiA/AmiB activator)
MDFPSDKTEERKMTLQRIETQIADARKQLDRATAQRDAAVTALIRSAEKIKQAQRTLARLEKRRMESRAQERLARREASKRLADDGAVPALT